ncbi:hypothetical protein Kpol_1066p21 [Vanderwaltozyma polyspora DSM 70294]|uniref:Protein BTN n=1 Tax=Vanderwaltozyma polyspora (strain ATCC 22028 / DSM 70294 / BCRC 21397 / CBS 2163 / NBRC 10782 / NRRL Y-8283 / UCD 57-17) TaxID=436907 RepID=A7TMP2_VANPO|nr:uncharacterized protein Kpol_1066p21 [Vanderwaltozyma polyspora DSM 70294]EDO16456.1 hypothetical protein Kpol_1066p21 [Vanderwaltozyma polyspora DSM 70294]
MVNHSNIKKTYGYFWIFGFVNNVLYVVILSAAVDIVGPSLPKSLVLLADILPSFLIKLTSPFFIHKIKYSYRVISLIFMSLIGMIFVSNSSLMISLLGITIASISSGFGEVTFLQLTNYYKEESLDGWSSGTGGAGLIGSGIYMLLTSILHFPVRISLLLFSVLPISFLLYFQLTEAEITYTPIYQNQESGSASSLHHIQPVTETEFMAVAETHDSDVLKALLDSSSFIQLKEHVRNIFNKLHALFIPYMLPLTSVYLFEYLINQAVSPTLLFPIDDEHKFPLFHKYRDIYVTYGSIYQLGVFISRSTSSYIRLKNLWLLAILQSINFILVILQSWYFFIKSPIPIFILILYEGLLGGASYVNTFLNILEDVDDDNKEFALGAVSIADSLGILIAALIGLNLEPTLCKHQIRDNRPWCEMQ